MSHGVVTTCLRFRGMLSNRFIAYLLHAECANGRIWKSVNI